MTADVSCSSTAEDVQLPCTANQKDLRDPSSPVANHKAPSHAGLGFNAASLSLRAQKKIASKFSSRNVSKLFLTDSANRLFDHLYAVLKEHYPKNDAEKVVKTMIKLARVLISESQVVKNMIKLAVKLGLLARNDMLSAEELAQVQWVQKQLHTLALTVVSFEQVEYSYERAFFTEILDSVQQAIEPLVVLNLSDKSTRRLDHVFEHLRNPTVSDLLFKVNGPQAALLRDITRDLEILIEARDI